jgi:hypothetical protein
MKKSNFYLFLSQVRTANKPIKICRSNIRSRSQPPRCAGSGRKSAPAASNAREERCALAQSKELVLSFDSFLVLVFFTTPV